jgi:ribosomal protein L11
MQVLYKIEVFLRSQLAEPGPPLGTVLGNLGLNATKFCKEFNDFTKELPTYFMLRTVISVLEDKSFSIQVFLPSIGFIISLLKFERSFLRHGKPVSVSCITAKNVVSLAKFKFPQLPLETSVPMVCGSVMSAGLKIVED